ncbi:16S rRNA (cytidine(1402)-2'-O)-methyltransferase [candidate division WWE3 bacterium RBG_19FT_COMBO_34_6]|uniref:Ribosomal RNA small subunit methyltransferase I n=1 Tax=candidate division WWE3 bacterium RBG_19FT_COMBO_34_6 TaxID=1802612 RepID=A0A1F4UM02_UNCKA|nr:MAG: 16S rRNA (cytidine(1402)-2'-O)-methyltransferase [candidate division WWE3 bacterium RBG_19FT_COMBO_34_6]
MDIKGGILYVVGSPIGNLDDITFRAVYILKNVNLILSEDTRETDKILQRYNIKTPQISYTDHKHDFLINEIIKNINLGYNYAIISDSGTPLISDPGFKLVNRLIKEGIKCFSIPGPSSPIAALSISGLPTDKFIFLGFLPKGTKQKEMIQKYGELDVSIIILESSHRIKKTIYLLYDALGDRMVCVCKDLTKFYENVKTKRLSYFVENIDLIKEKGEYTIIIAKKDFNLNG